MWIQCTQTRVFFLNSGAPTHNPISVDSNKITIYSTENKSAIEANDKVKEQDHADLTGKLSTFCKTIGRIGLKVLSYITAGCKFEDEEEETWLVEPIPGEIISSVKTRIFNDRPLYCELSKKEFESIILKEVLGSDKISSNFVDHLFSECDTDKDGWVGVEALTNYL